MALYFFSSALTSGVINGDGVASTFGEWTSKRSYKDRKNASKLKNSIGSQLALATSEPELFFYGKNSGVVGLQRTELFSVADNAEASNLGYDKVLHEICVKRIAPPLAFACCNFEINITWKMFWSLYICRKLMLCKFLNLFAADISRMYLWILILNSLFIKFF